MVYHIKTPSKETIKKFYNFCLEEILSILHLSNLQRRIDVKSLEEVTNIQLLLLNLWQIKCTDIRTY